MFLKTKPIPVGIFYKPPSQTRILEQMVTEFESLELNNELYILGDFNINLLFKGNVFLVKLTKLKIILKTFRWKLKNTMSFVQYVVLNNR